MQFTKMHGLGNDYVYVNGFEETVTDAPALARAMSDRHTGVGSDGLILICASDVADVRMEMYNADGSRGRMCGNGIRCVAKYAYDHGLVARPGFMPGRGRPGWPDNAQNESLEMLLRHLTVRGLKRKTVAMTIETDSGVLPAAVLLDGPSADHVCVDVGCPDLAPGSIPTTMAGERIVDHPMEVADHRFNVTCVSMGSPHLVIFVDDLDPIDVPTVGPPLENHSVFPDRVNVHFARVVTRDSVEVRHWERGSGVTQACGTGACAVCVAGALTERTDREVEVLMAGGRLRICWDANNHVYMTGPAVEVFTGCWLASSST